MKRTCILISILAAWAAGAIEDYFPYPVRNFSDAMDLRKDPVFICYGSGMADLAKKVQAGVTGKFNLTLPLLADSAADSARIRRSHLILIGNGMDNLVLRRLYYNHKCLLDAANPGKDGFFVTSVHDPLYNGKNAVIIGGSSKAGHERAVSEFLAILPSPDNPVLKNVFAAKTIFDTLEAGDTLSYDSLVRLHTAEYRSTPYGGAVLGKAVSNLMAYYWTRKPAFRKRGVSVLEAYLRMARENKDDFYGFHPMNDVYFHTWKWVTAWELVEADPAFTERDKKVVLSATWGIYKYIEDNLTKTYMNPDITVEGEPRQNHVIFGTYSCFITSRYFAGRYGLAEKERWYGLVDNVMKGQHNSCKPNDDANHYIWIVPNFTLSYDLYKGDTLWTTTRLPRLAEAIVAVTGNDKIVVNFGDASSLGRQGLDDGLRIVNMASYFNRDPALLGFARWVNGEPSQRDPKLLSQTFMGILGTYDFEGKTAPFTKYAGVFPALLDEGALNWIARRAPVGTHLPRRDGRYIDKLSMRPDFEAKSEYLLLEGVGGMSHSHTDGNAISDLMWNGRHFLSDGIYDAIYPEFHSMLRVRKDGLVSQRPILTELVCTHESKTTGMSTTLSPDATGADWYRHILWIKRKGFFVMDEVQALSDGQYDLNNRFRTRGERALSGNTLTLRQDKETFLITCGDGSRLSLSEEMLKNNRASRQKIAGANPALAPVEVLLMDRSVRLSAGGSCCFGALMAPGANFREHSVVPLATRGGHAYLLAGNMAAGTAREGMTAGGFSITAGQFLATREALECAGVSFLSFGKARFASSRPVSLSVNLKTGAAD